MSPTSSVAASTSRHDTNFPRGWKYHEESSKYVLQNRYCRNEVFYWKFKLTSRGKWDSWTSAAMSMLSCAESIKIENLSVKTPQVSWHEPIKLLLESRLSPLQASITANKQHAMPHNNTKYGMWSWSSTLIIEVHTKWCQLVVQPDGCRHSALQCIEKLD